MHLPLPSQIKNVFTALFPVRNCNRRNRRNLGLHLCRWSRRRRPHSHPSSRCRNYNQRRRNPSCSHTTRIHAIKLFCTALALGLWDDTPVVSNFYIEHLLIINYGKDKN